MVSPGKPGSTFCAGIARALALLSCTAILLAACTSVAPAPPPARSEAAPSAPARPDALVGTWLFEMKRGSGGDAIQHSLHFSMSNGIVAGSITGPDGNSRELTNIVLAENGKVAWDVEGQLHYDGTLEGSSMKGTARRSASKRRSRGDSGDESGDNAGPPPGGSGGYGRGGGRGGRGGRGGSGGSRSAEGITWSAYKSVLPSPESAAPAPSPTPSSRSVG